MEENKQQDALSYFLRQDPKPTFRCEPDLQAMCKLFDGTWPECTPAEGNRKSWYHGLRVIYREFGSGQGLKFLEWAKLELATRNKQRKAQGQPPLSMVDAHSIGFLIPDYKKLLSGKGNVCPECGEPETFCTHEWGSNRRHAKWEDEI